MVHAPKNMRDNVSEQYLAKIGFLRGDYVDGRAGLSFGNSVGAYSSIALGLRIAMERKTGLLIAAEYDVGEYDILLFSKGLGLRIGYEF